MQKKNKPKTQHKYQQQSQQNANLQQPNHNQAIYTKDDHIFIVINAKPNSKQSLITEINDQYIAVAISSPATDNQANTCLIEFMADVLEIKKSQLEIVKGQKSRSKLIKINVSMDIDEVINSINRYK